MTFTKPQILVSGEALCLTKGQLKGCVVQEDFGGPVGTTMWNTQPAYESDE